MESANLTVDPSADVSTPADWQGRGAATKELEEAVEGPGRTLRVIRSWLGLAIYEDPLSGDGKKTQVAPSCKLETVVVWLEDVKIEQKNIY